MQIYLGAVQPFDIRKSKLTFQLKKTTTTILPLRALVLHTHTYGLTLLQLPSTVQT